MTPSSLILRLHALIVLFNHVGIPHFRSFRLVPDRILALLTTTRILRKSGILLPLGWRWFWLGIVLELLVQALFERVSKVRTILLIFQDSLVLAPRVLLLTANAKIRLKTVVNLLVDWLWLDWMPVGNLRLTFLDDAICRVKIIKLVLLHRRLAV